jgi:hypothetical protein
MGRGDEKRNSQDDNREKTVFGPQIFWMALPYFLFAAIGMRNPSYPVLLIAKGQWQPLGWLAIVLILGLTGILFWISWKIASGWNDRKRMHRVVFLALFWMLDSLLLSLLLVAPAIVVILTSPVGRMLTG